MKLSGPGKTMLYGPKNWYGVTVWVKFNDGVCLENPPEIRLAYSTVYPSLDSEIFSEATKGMYRCFTVIPKDDIVEKGIHTVILFPGTVGKVPLSKVYFHQPEVFRPGHSDI